ncbi:hypothetical protein A4H97_26280 [Niastella yeongjuensis]|uniref:DUF2442 domain-containing protein n=1 Tax=Niastella yeongjuensis TaxID=354355 RepID=A0A1V9F075_9BACT|nr:DUF2442 domain-containing protein [Niastella yeongjuensis]OQP51722.1 hypothetical protein A4H97_26280 [Niastella yeongjuensis]SEP48947.1 Protein of unknown function [Niastella yeongjuensis]
MSTSANKQFDAIDNIIFKEGLRIKAVDIHPELDLITIYLNTKAVLSQNISSYALLRGVEKPQLLQYELIGGGIGIHWPLLDEDLSLKGFLQDELRRVVKSDKAPIAA